MVVYYRCTDEQIIYVLVANVVLSILNVAILNYDLVLVLIN